MLSAGALERAKSQKRYFASYFSETSKWMFAPKQHDQRPGNLLY